MVVGMTVAAGFGSLTDAAGMPSLRYELLSLVVRLDIRIDFVFGDILGFRLLRKNQRS